MDEFRYYTRMFTGYKPTRFPEHWKISRKMHLCADGDSLQAPGLGVYIGLAEELFDEIPESTEYEKYTRSPRDAFKKCWNENFESLQKARLHGGEYYIAKDASGHDFTFHAFLREPSRHYSISCRQEVGYAHYDISTENTIIYRRGVAFRHRAIPESVFIQAFKIALEFFYDGSVIPANQGLLTL